MRRKPGLLKLAPCDWLTLRRLSETKLGAPTDYPATQAGWRLSFTLDVWDSHKLAHVTFWQSHWAGPAAWRGDYTRGEGD